MRLSVSSTDPQSTRSSPLSPPEAPQMQSPTSVEKEVPKKKKRSRMSKEQLAQLERVFLKDRSPTGPRRQELSLQIGAPERQIQVWFQNRRAKAKNSNEKLKSRVPRVPIPVKEPPELCQAVQTELAMLIQEDDQSIFTIPCSTLSIGSWSRVNVEDRKELLAWICERKRCIVWFVHSKDYSFKMQVPLDNLKEILFKNADPGKALLTIDISRPPSFFLRRNAKREDGAPSPVWRRCEDWTENKAASRVLRHVLEGPAMPLANVITHVKNQMGNMKQVELHPVNYPANNLCPPPTSTTSTYHGADDGFYFTPASRELGARSWDSQPCAGNQLASLNVSKPSLHPYQTYGGSNGGALGLHGMDVYAHPQTGHDRTRLIDIHGGIHGVPLDRLSPLPVLPKLPSYLHTIHHAQTHHVASGYHLSVPLPGLSELLAPSRDSQ